MNRSVLNRTLLNTSVLCQSRLNQSGLASLCGKSGGIPSAIRRAMVLWYDIERQGCTNENMAENPILKDLSGNGYDATCYNFAWSGMSGVGGYNVDFSTFAGKYGTINGNVVTIDTTNSDITAWYWASRIDYNGSPFKVNCTFIEVDPNSNNQVLVFQRSGGTNKYLCSEGYNEVPAISGSEGSELQFSIFGKVKIIIEFIPEYPNALVSDGVDDYCLAEGLPLLTREKGYTVVARRKWFTNEKATAFVAKNTNSNGEDGGFQFEYVNGTGNNFWTSSFASNTNISDLYTSEEAIVYQTSKNYNGQKNLIPKAVSDTGGMALFRFSVDGSDLFGQFALYTLLLFNRDLTEDEINWVKTNLITV